jgi:hypothetical protein
MLDVLNSGWIKEWMAFADVFSAYFKDWRIPQQSPEN